MITSTERFPMLDKARQDFERIYIHAALARSNGNVAAAARLANRDRSAFWRKAKQLRVISEPKAAPAAAPPADGASVQPCRCTECGRPLGIAEEAAE